MQVRPVKVTQVVLVTQQTVTAQAQAAAQEPLAVRAVLRQKVLVEQVRQTALRVAALPMQVEVAGAVILMLRRQAVQAVQAAEVRVAQLGL